MQLLLERIRRPTADTVIVMGDFNAGEGNAAIQPLEGGESPALRDTFRAIHPGARDVATYHGFGGGTEGEKIDFIFASPELKVLDAAIVRGRRGGRYPSDHYPVIARLSW